MGLAGKTRVGQLVVPGERLGVVEEFSVGEGVYEVDGSIYSERVGLTRVDSRDRTINVQPIDDKPCLPKVGDVVTAYVVTSQDKAAFVEIVKIDDKPLNAPFEGVVHLLTVGLRYVRRVNEAYKPRDVIRARVSSLKNMTYHLSTMERNLGVLQAYCSICGMQLMRDKGILRCQSCGNLEKRKIAQD